MTKAERVSPLNYYEIISKMDNNNKENFINFSANISCNHDNKEPKTHISITPSKPIMVYDLVSLIL